MDSTAEPTAALLRGYLDQARQAVLFKAEGLGERLARTPMTPTGTHVLGVVHHLAITEYGYFGPCLGRTPQDAYVNELLALDDPQVDFLPPARMGANEVLELYRGAIRFANAGFDQLPLHAPAEVPWWVARRHTTLEHLLVHMIAETSRHAGHLDIVRELLDGKVGLRPEAPNLPDFNAVQWTRQHARLDQIARATAGPGGHIKE